MSSSVVGYWVGDSLGRVLGPLQLQAFRDLIASGRLKTAVRASRDGTNWIALQELPEVRDLFTTAAPTPSVENQQAERLRNQLRGLLHLPPHEVFGLKPQASLDEFRLAFFRMAKRFSPEHLSPDLHPELRKVSVEIFDFLSRRIREAETLFLQGAMQPPAPPPPRLDMGGALPSAPLPMSGSAVPARPPPVMTPQASRPQAAAIPPTPVPGSLTRPPAAEIPPTPVPGSLTRSQAAAIPPTPVPGSFTRPQAAAIPPTPVPGSMTRPVVPPAPPRPPPVMTPTTRPVTPPPPAPAPAPPPPAPIRRPMAAPAPSYSSAEFVGLERRSDDRLHADVKVSMKNMGIFTDHRIINLSSGGLFIGTDRPLRLGTQVELTLRFDDPERVMTLRSSVIWENSLDDGKNPKGYGLRLSSLRAEERDFIQQYVRRPKKP
ncbi:TIGR02266 family protein [Corallococcus sp. AB032C]|nr:TIGR02266 family protein [Corallococcus sp. AB032C]NNB87371.1 TIGR02266 family protein [Corallococcus exiguus]RKH83188.1 TIGR02266 family protein [Corallococcus sp. AB032C]